MSTESLAETWNRNANIDPFYTVLSEDDKRGGRWDRDEFFKTGEREMAELHGLLTRLGRTLQGRNAIDFGCGLGRLTEALAPYFEQVVGVDISHVMIECAKTMSKNRNVTYVLSTDPDMSEFPDQSVDFIISRLVLQHTGRRLARSYLNDFGRILRPGGLADVQVPVGFKNLKGVLIAILPRWVLRRLSTGRQGVVFTQTSPIRPREIERIFLSNHCKVLDVRIVEVNSSLRIASYIVLKQRVND
jgi:ubiquinone/menaquinone biosynthesis C-methylase UbiE